MVHLSVYATLVALSHGISLYFFIFLSARLGADAVASIGLLESSLYLTISIVSFGMLQLAARDVVSGENVSTVARRFQSLRLAIGLLVGSVGLAIYLSTGENKWAMFVMAPIFALNVDYLLYAVGRAHIAGIVALVRQGLPYLALMFIVSVGYENVDLYFIALTFIGFLLAGLLSAHFLGIQYFYRPSFNLADKVKPVLTVGVSDFTYNAMRGSLPLISSLFLQKEQVFIVYGFFKLLMVFVGVRRLLIQFFYSRLVDPNLAKKVDWLVRGGSAVLFVICIVMRRDVSIAYFGNPTIDPDGIVILVYATVFLLMSVYTTTIVRLIQFHREIFFMKSILITGFVFFLSCYIGMLFDMPPLVFLFLFGFYELFLGFSAAIKTKNLRRDISIT